MLVSIFEMFWNDVCIHLHSQVQIEPWICKCGADVCGSLRSARFIEEFVYTRTHKRARACLHTHTHAQACTLTYADLLSPLPFLRAQGGLCRLKRDSRKSFICLCCLIKSLFCQFCFTVDVLGPVYFSIASLRSEMGLLDTRKKVLWLTQRLDASSCSGATGPSK